MTQKWCLTLFFLFLLFLTEAVNADPLERPYCDQDFLVGQGISDITGPPAEIPMMGYGMMEQTTAGIHMRLRSRAFILQSLCNEKRVVFVSADLGMIFQAVKTGVLQRLRETFGDLYTDQNILLSAIHTHSGPGGYSHHILYDFTIKGFHAKTYQVIVNGIYKSIVNAHHNIQRSKLFLNKGKLQFASMNRSRAAYLMNPMDERMRYPDDTNKEMLLLKFVGFNGKPIGLVNWFAVHPTNVGNANRLITSDNKGYASYLFETMMGNHYDSSPDAFVAAFAQADEGDVSPNLWGPPDGTSDYEHAQAIGIKQFEKAKALYESASVPVKGTIDYRHSYVDFSHVTVEPEWSGEDIEVRTCPAALGASFAAGSVEDGPSHLPIFREGMVSRSKWWDRLPWPNLQECHKEKIILLPTGLSPTSLWTQKSIPIQIVTIGPLALVALPFECTTMCGRRIRETVAKELRPVGITDVVIAGLSNAYVGYMTTREEYSLQHYEGGSTYFGPWMLAAFQQEASRVARALKNDEPVDPGPEPEDLSTRQKSFHLGVWFDETPPGQDFGDVIEDTKTDYTPGQTAHVSFWGAHLNNELFIENSYLKIQLLTPDGWIDVAHDWDPETTITWKRRGVSYSEILITWAIPLGVSPGTYRILHQGYSKDFWTRRTYPYSGRSRSFLVH
ncbi:MAG: neutral/alkaline ceramidase [Deltaproteobacteria bacterium]|nr:neutral/alkaline ceramidase [Deltaproteobacteria bacterium]